jgi:hypothetical protein
MNHFPFIKSQFFIPITKKVCLLIFLILGSGLTAGLYAQNVAINSTGASPKASAMLDISSANKGLLLPRVTLTGTGDVSTIPLPDTSLLVYNTATAGTAPANVVPGYYFWTGAKWSAFTTPNSSLIPFSTGNILNGASVVSAAPILMGFGNSTVQAIDGLGTSVFPPQMGGFSFTAPYTGIIKDLQVSADLLVVSPIFINTIGLRYDFTVFVGSSSPNNGISHFTLQYLTTPLTVSVNFGFPYTGIAPGTYQSATNLNTGSISVNAGDRIGIRVRTSQGTDPSASDITQLSFNASVRYLTTQ